MCAEHLYNLFNMVVPVAILFSFLLAAHSLSLFISSIDIVQFSKSNWTIKYNNIMWTVDARWWTQREPEVDGPLRLYYIWMFYAPEPNGNSHIWISYDGLWLYEERHMPTIWMSCFHRYQYLTECVCVCGVCLAMENHKLIDAECMCAQPMSAYNIYDNIRIRNICICVVAGSCILFGLQIPFRFVVWYWYLIRHIRMPYFMCRVDARLE